MKNSTDNPRVEIFINEYQSPEYWMNKYIKLLERFNDFLLKYTDNPPPFDDEMPTGPRDFFFLDKEPD